MSPTTTLLPLSLAVALALPAAAATPVRAPIEVRGGDFPLLTRATGIPVALDAQGFPMPPGCDAVRARRPEELSPPWREVVESIALECEPMEADERSQQAVALSVTARLRPQRVRLAGFDVREIRLMDSPLWSDHQYVLDVRYADVVGRLKNQLAADCKATETSLPTPQAPHSACGMTLGEQDLHLNLGEGLDMWLYPDPDDAGLTIYAEGWAL